MTIVNVVRLLLGRILIKRSRKSYFRHDLNAVDVVMGLFLHIKKQRVMQLLAVPYLVRLSVVSKLARETASDHI